MDRRTFSTAAGKVWLHGVDRGGVGLLVITGAFAAEDAMRPLVDVFPNRSVWIGHIPGNHCPRLSEHSVAAFTAAYSAAATDLGPLVVCGVSLGGLIALGLRSANIRGVLALEPLLQTAPAWPLRERFASGSPGELEFVRSIFGYPGPGIDYRPVLGRLCRPVTVMVGDEPLGSPRPHQAVPSLLGEDDRALLAAHPLVTLRIAQDVGHDIGQGASDLILEALDELLVRANQPDDEPGRTAGAACAVGATAAAGGAARRAG